MVIFFSSKDMHILNGSVSENTDHKMNVTHYSISIRQVVGVNKKSQKLMWMQCSYKFYKQAQFAVWKVKKL